MDQEKPIDDYEIQEYDNPYDETTAASVALELGDMVRLDTATGQWKNVIFSVDYLSETRIDLKNVKTCETVVLIINDQGEITNASIDNWEILFRFPERGYARQHGLVPGVAVELTLVDNTVVHGRIVQAVEDMIEIQTASAAASIPVFIDFEYKGLPSFLLSIRAIDNEAAAAAAAAPLEEPPPPDEWTAVPTEIEQVLREIYIDEQDLLGEDIGVVNAEIPENERIYGIDGQTNDLLDHWVQSVPLSQRTPRYLERVHHQIDLYKHLRTDLYEINEYGLVVQKRLSRTQIDATTPWTVDQQWLMPVVALPLKKLYYQIYGDEKPTLATDAPDNTILIVDSVDIIEQSKLSVGLNTSETQKPYDLYNQRIQNAFCPFAPAAAAPPPAFDQDRLIEEAVVTTQGAGAHKKWMRQRVVTEDAPPAIEKIIQLPTPFVLASRLSARAPLLYDRVNISKVYLWFDKIPKDRLLYYSINDTDDPDLSWEQNRMRFVDVIKQYTLPNTAVRKITMMEIIQQLEPFTLNAAHLEITAWRELRRVVTTVCNQILRRPQPAVPTLDAAVISPVNELLTLLQTPDAEINRQFLSYLQEYYKVRPNATASETVAQIVAIDKSALFSTMVQYLLYFLNNVDADKMIEWAFPDIVNINDLERPQQRNPYPVRLVKVYTNMKDMRKKPLLYDAIFDDTPYDLYNTKYAPRRQAEEPHFRDFLRQSLRDVEKIDDDREIEEIIDAWLQGGKSVQVGDYCMLIERPPVYAEAAAAAAAAPPKEQYRFFVLSPKGAWVEDTNKLSRSSQEALLEQYKNHLPGTRRPRVAKFAVAEITTQTLREHSAVLFEQLKTYMRSIVWKTAVERDQSLRLSRLLNRYFTPAVAADILQSPYADLRQQILAEPDFPTKQFYIVKFYNKFCRDAVGPPETEHWGYCRETAVPLFPRSLYELAVAFLNDTYIDTLDRLIGLIGVKSGDGEAIVDKHTNYVLKRLDNVVQDEYDDSGFKIITHSVLQTDNAVDAVLQELDTQEYKNPMAAKVHKVFRVLKQKLGIDDKTRDIENRVMQHSMRILCKSNDTCEPNTMFLMTARQFKKEQDKNKELEAKKGKKAPAEIKNYSYSDYINRTIVAVTAAMCLVAVQTAVPSVRPRLTINGCVYSYGGYPLSGDKGDLSGLTFLACVLCQYAALGDDHDVWNAIKRPFHADRLALLSRNVLQTLLEIKKDAPLLSLYATKHTYLRDKETQAPIPVHQSLARWTSFLPPLVEYSIIGSVALEEKTLRPAADVLALRAANILRGYVFVEKVAKIVSTETLLLPHIYLQNTCCNENETHPLTYFITKDPTLKVDCLQVQKNDVAIDTALSTAHSPFLFFGGAAAVQPTPEPHSGTEVERDLMYEALIHYSKYDYNGIDVLPDAAWADLCPPRPADYKREDSLKQKITILERNRIVWGVRQFTELQRRVNIKNQIAIQTVPPFSLKDRLGRLVELNKEYKCIPSPEIFDWLNGGASLDERATAGAFTLLFGEIQLRVETIQSFLQRKTSKNAETTQVNAFLKNIVDGSSAKIVNNGDNSQNIQFIRNSIYEIIYSYPYEILYSTHSRSFVVPEHWKFSETHQSRLTQLINKYTMNQFIDENETPLKKYLREKVPVLCDYLEWVDIVATATTSLDPRLAQLLLKYIWVLVLHHLVPAAAATDDIALDEDEMDDEVDSSIVEFIHTVLYFQSVQLKIINYNYKQLHLQNFKLTEQEKQTEFIDRIGKMNNYEQKVDKLLRQLKLGQYYVEPNFYKDPDFLEKRKAAAAAAADDIPPAEELDGNLLYDPEYNDEDEYGEDRFDVEEY
jgi:hypothetical protein